MTIAIIMIGPWFAVAGLAAVGLVVWMHLYQRVASRRMPVSSLRLVPETPRVARSRRRIRRWPLFLLRALGVLLLGAAFARPGLPGGGQAPVGGRETVVFVLDRSGSMAMRSAEGASAWEEARKQVQSRLAGLHPESRVRLFCFPPAAVGGDWSSPAAMRKLVVGLTPSLADGRPFDALREAAEALARFRSDMPESLEVVGDLQRQGWEEIDTLTLPEELRVHVSQTGAPEAANRSLSLQVRGSDQLRRGVVEVVGGTTPLIVIDRVGEGGEVAEREIPLPDKVAEREIPLPDKVVELPYRAAANGWVRREVAFRQATDGLAEDDRLFDAFLVTPEIPVYLLEPHPERDAFLQTTFFLHQALRPTAGDAAADSRFLPRVVSVKDAADALHALAGREAVVVVPPLATWPTELPAAVEAFLRQGGGVVFFAGPDLQPPAYAAAWRDLLPALPGETLPVELSLALPPIGETHPIWGGFSEDLRQALRKVPLKKRFALAVAEGAEVTARYADEVPLVVRRQVGSGRVVFVNTSPDRAWGDWPADGAQFVPTMHMLMSAVLTSTSQALRNSPGAGIVGVPFDVRVDQASAGVPLRTGDRALRADEQGWVRGLSFDHPGLFDILTENGRVVRPVAVNFPPDESRREFFRPAILQRQIEARRRVAGADGDAPRINLASESGWWRWILAALAVVWLVEPWLAFRPARDLGSKGLAS
ncbi:MAG: BatA domain-containing protein [Verrucomicrobia bacterium]|nr:BatA domain-containing protein [Verrucomicrobiota bacterium]